MDPVLYYAFMLLVSCFLALLVIIFCAIGACTYQEIRRALRRRRWRKRFEKAFPDVGDDNPRTKIGWNG